MDRLLRTTQAGAGDEVDAQDPAQLAPDALIEVVAAEAAGEYRLRIRFSDGAARVVDFEPFLRASANPLIRRYLEPDVFSGFRIEYGDLLWGDYELCFPIADLYEDRL